MPRSFFRDLFYISSATSGDPERPAKDEYEEFERREENRISVGPAGSELHPLAVKLRAALRGAKEEKGEILKGDAERPV